MIHPQTNSTKTIRAVFIIDPEDKIRAIFYYPMEIGRNIEEIKRTIIALQTADKEDVLTPANWQPGGDVLINSPKTAEESEKLEEKRSSKFYNLTWYMWYKKI